MQPICDFADQFHPEFPQTKSLNEVVTGHDGVFLVEERNISDYRTAYAPQPLRYSRSQDGISDNPINYGAAKGMTFERTLIYPHGPLRKFLNTGKLEDAGKEIPKLYIATTRAKQSVAFVVPNGFQSAILPLFHAGDT